MAVLGMIACCAADSVRAEAPGGLKFSRKCLMLSPNEGCAATDVNKDGVLDADEIRKMAEKLSERKRP